MKITADIPAYKNVLAFLYKALLSYTYAYMMNTGEDLIGKASLFKNTFYNLWNSTGSMNTILPNYFTIFVNV